MGLCQGGSEHPLALMRSVEGSWPSGGAKGTPWPCWVPHWREQGPGKWLRSVLDRAVESLVMCVGWVRDVPEWARIQHPRVLVRTKVDIGQARQKSLSQLSHVGAVPGYGSGLAGL